MIDPGIHTDFSQGFGIRARAAIWIEILQGIMPGEYTFLRGTLLVGKDIPNSRKKA